MEFRGKLINAVAHTCCYCELNTSNGESVQLNEIKFSTLCIYVLTQQAKGQLYSKHEQRWKQMNIHAQRKTRQGNLCYLDNNKNLITTILASHYATKNVYSYSHIAYNQYFNKEKGSL